MDDVTDSGSSTSAFRHRRFNKDGRLDRSFDGDGKLLVDMPGVEPSFVNALAIQPDERSWRQGRPAHVAGLTSETACRTTLPSHR